MVGLPSLMFKTYSITVWEVQWNRKLEIKFWRLLQNTRRGDLGAASGIFRNGPRLSDSSLQGRNIGLTKPTTLLLTSMLCWIWTGWSDDLWGHDSLSFYIICFHGIPKRRPSSPRHSADLGIGFEGPPKDYLQYPKGEVSSPIPKTPTALSSFSSFMQLPLLSTPSPFLLVPKSKLHSTTKLWWATPNSCSTRHDAHFIATFLQVCVPTSSINFSE